MNLPFNEMNLFATIFSSLGIDPYAEYDLLEFPTFHRVKEKTSPIDQIYTVDPAPGDHKAIDGHQSYAQASKPLRHDLETQRPFT
ncbi:MAG: hypothetical protein M2R45_02418 [Verrucomicrobia subdivision 3 bacterium]|nr:hypothetical protein [Limisphaerales bacterium]MCS1416376.1 hypothetical protein [Limisphaerales bacterium]